MRPRTRRALDDARAAGIRVLICTGRMFRSARPFADEAGVVDPVVCYQGGMIVDPVTEEVLHHDPVPLELAREAIEATRAEGLTINIYLDEEIYVDRRTAATEEYVAIQKAPIPVHEVGDLLAWLDRAPTKLVSIDDADRLLAVEGGLRERFDGRLNVMRSLPRFLEFTTAGATKYHGLERLAALLGLERSRIVAFGDGENDFDLLRFAGYGVAVANAHPVLREQADFVCPSVDDEGVAQVVESFLHSVR